MQHFTEELIRVIAYNRELDTTDFTGARLAHKPVTLAAGQPIAATEATGLAHSEGFTFSSFLEGSLADKGGPLGLFCDIAVQLAAMHMSTMGSDFSLEHICGSAIQFSTIGEQPARLLGFVLLPLCVCLGSGRAGESLSNWQFLIVMEWNGLICVFPWQMHQKSYSVMSTLLWSASSVA